MTLRQVKIVPRLTKKLEQRKSDSFFINYSSKRMTRTRNNKTYSKQIEQLKKQEKFDKLNKRLPKPKERDSKKLITHKSKVGYRDICNNSYSDR